MRRTIVALTLLLGTGVFAAEAGGNASFQQAATSTTRRHIARQEPATKLFTRKEAREAIAASQSVAPGGIDVLKPVEIGGIQQWISVRGNDPANPILLFLHGGPGSPMMPESWTFQRPWEDFFTVVQWDQRGAGKTFSAAGRKPDPTMTIGEMQTDAEQLIDVLRHTYRKKKIFLLGFSWGSILGVRIAQHRPNWLYAYIGVGQVVNGQQNEIVGYRETLAKAKSAGNRAAVRALEALAPYPSPHGVTPLRKTLIERRWDAALGGMKYGRTKENGEQIWSMSPEYTDYDVDSARLGEISSVRILWPQMAAVNFDSIRNFECPVFFFSGMHDRTTPEPLVQGFYNQIQAPEKMFFKIPRAAHYVVNEEPGLVLMDLVRYVRPLARDGGER